MNNGICNQAYETLSVHKKYAVTT